MRSWPASRPLPAAWTEATRLLVRYVAALWPSPNSDCWEEFPDRSAVSTLAALHAGLRATSAALGTDDPDGHLAATAARIAADLVRATGGVYRYRADTYYGGGEWILLTALLGAYWAAAGEVERARRCLAYVEAHADAQGHLPEQIITAPLDRSYVAEWTERWGEVARPLLWSHAAYLSLSAAVKQG